MFNFLFNPCGRVSRKQIWLMYVFPVLIAGFAAGVLDAAVFGSALSAERLIAGEVRPPTPGFTLLLNLFLIWPSIAVPVKRFHDRGMTGWWVLLFAVGIGFSAAFAIFEVLANAGAGSMGSAGVALFVMGALLLTQFVILYCLPGEDGSNKYGDDPRDPGAASIADVFGDAKPAAPAWAESVDFKAALGAAGGPQTGAAAPAPTARYGRARSAPAPSEPVTFGRRAR